MKRNYTGLKKAAAFVLMLGLTLQFTACGGAEKVEESNEVVEVTATPEPTEKVTNTPTPEPTEEIISTPTPEPAEEVTNTPTPHMEKKTDDGWKQAYAKIVKEWDIMHARDSDYGYELAYIDDNDVPELVLSCSDEVFYAMNMYTYIEGAAVRMEVFDKEGNKAASTYVSPGWQGKQDAYIKKGNIYFQMGGMSQTITATGYRMEGSSLYETINYRFTDESWLETSEDPVYYMLEYMKSDGNPVSVRKSLVEGQYFEIQDVPEAKDLEKEYHFSFKNRHLLGEEGKMGYVDICKALSVNPDYEMTANEIYASLLLQYMYDGKCISDGLDACDYKSCGGKFMLKDINGDGIEEMIMTVSEGMECTLFIPKKTWEEAALCNFNKYSDDGILEYAYGDMRSTLTYQQFDGSTLSYVDEYECEEWDTEEFWGTYYYHIDQAGNRTDISSEQYEASQNLYGVHSVTGEWHEINQEEIQKYLLKAVE